MGSASRIANYSAAGVAQLISMYSRPRGTIVSLAPVILGISPAFGLSSGGALVRITGYNFEGVSSVTIGGVECTGLIVGGGIITCYAPAGSLGAQNVVVTGPAGQQTLANGFSFYAIPTVTNVSPNTGSGGGVTIAGTGFTGATSVFFGAAPATGITVVNATTITCTAPTGTGAVNVSVTTPVGTGTSSAPVYTYSVGTAPTVTAIAPATFDTAGGGNAVTITGTGFTGATGVTIGGTAATNVTVVNSTTITCIPGARSAGAGLSVVVTTPAGQNGANAFAEYWTPAQITGISTYLDAAKGVTGGAAVSAWLDQSANARNFQQATGANKPAQTASVFNSLPSIRFTPQQWVSLAAEVVCASGASKFLVAKWTATRAVATGSDLVPLCGIGSQLGGWGGFGASGGSICSAEYPNVATTAGSGLNSGSPQLIGVTYDLVPNIKYYQGATQQGSTIIGGGSVDTRNAYDTIGNGAGSADGWNGDMGAVIVVSGIIAAGDLTKLNAWSQQRWGTP